MFADDRARCVRKVRGASELWSRKKRYQDLEKRNMKEIEKLKNEIEELQKRNHEKSRGVKEMDDQLRIKLDKLLSLFDLSAFLNHPEDSSPATATGFDLANDLRVAATLNFTLLQHNVIKRSTIGSLCNERIGID